MRFQSKIEQKPNIIQRQFPKNVTFIYVRYAVFILLVFWKKNIWTKTPYETATIFKKCSVFYGRFIIFLLLFFERIWATTPYNTAKLLKNATFFTLGTSSLFSCFLSKKRTKCEVAERNWAKTQNDTATISLKCNVFYGRYIVFISLFFVKKKNTMCDLRDNFIKNPI